MIREASGWFIPTLTHDIIHPGRSTSHVHHDCNRGRLMIGMYAASSGPCHGLHRRDVIMIRYLAYAMDYIIMIRTLYLALCHGLHQRDVIMIRVPTQDMIQLLHCTGS